MFPSAFLFLIQHLHLTLDFKRNIQSVNNVNNARKINGLNFNLLNKTEFSNKKGKYICIDMIKHQQFAILAEIRFEKLSFLTIVVHLIFLHCCF